MFKKPLNFIIVQFFQNFGGKRDMVYCGVFDGHGPFGHKVSCYVRDTLPSKLSWLFRDSDIHGKTCSHHGHGSKKKVINIDDSKDPVLSSWKKSIVESFKEMDEDLEANKSIDSYGSGSTSVSVIKQVSSVLIVTTQNSGINDEF